MKGEKNVYNKVIPGMHLDEAGINLTTTSSAVPKFGLAICLREQVKVLRRPGCIP